MAPRKKEVLFNFPNPMDNDVLIGHEKTYQTFMNAWENRDKYPVHPVWMLCGPRGIGKATLAYKIAKNVYGNVGDFFIVDLARNIDEHGNKRTDSKVISVNTVRNMIERLQLSSMSGQWRVILIDSVDELKYPAASNAILKLLEEPPANTLFLLITHQLSNVLPTIRSRARIEKMLPLSMNELRTLCNKFMPDADVSDEILTLANGSFGKIANLKASGGDVIYEDLLRILQSKSANSSDIMKIATKIAPTPAIYSIILDAIAHFGLADLYPTATAIINDTNVLNLKPEIAIFKIINDIKKCL